MALINLDKFVASFITEMKECSQMRNFSIPRCIKKALQDQGLEYKGGEIVKTQRRASAEAKELGYGESEDEKIVKLADEYYNKVLIKECDMEEKEAHHCRIAYIHGAKAMLERQRWRPSEEQMKALSNAGNSFRPFGECHKILWSLYNDLKKLKQQK